MSVSSDLTKSIINFLNYSGHLVWRNNTTGIYDLKTKRFRKHHGIKGVPDIIGIHRDTGKFIGIEVKVGKDRLSADQKTFIESSTSKGAIVIVAKCLDDVINNPELR